MIVLIMSCIGFVGSKIDLGSGCTEMGCVDGLEVNLSPEFSAPGSYELQLLLDETLVTCTADLPLSSESESCSSEEVWMLTSGSALAASEHRLTGWSTILSPELIEMVVLHESTVVLNEGFYASYEMLQPNGEDCEPTCYTESVTVTVP